ncbi:MFS transporter [Pseudomonas bharatica]|uniref:MFS transporter n=1 Tax=Pseudomonas bharatica TaxID=2692112 RepID=UPI003B280437
MTNTPQRHVWTAVAALIVAELALSYEISMIFAAVPRLSEVFGDHAKAGWLITGFMMVSAASAAVGGRLGDLYGRRRVLQYALALAVIGSAISALSSDFVGVFIGRTVQGCAACVLPLGIALVREALPPQRVALGVGLLLASAATGTGAGLFLGGYIVDRFDWPTLFYVSGALALLAMVIVAIAVPKSLTPASRESFDIVGGVLFVPGVGGVLYGLNALKENSVSDPLVLLPLSLGMLCLASWYAYERRHASPLIDVRTVFSGQVGLANLVMVLIATSVFQVSLLGSLLIQQPAETGIGFGKSATFYGLVHMPGTLLGVISSPIAGHLAGKFGARGVLRGACLLNAACWLLMAAMPDQLWVVVGSMAVIAMMGAAILTSIPNLIIENAPAARTGELVGFSIVVRNLSGGVGAQAAVAVLMMSAVTLGGRQYPSAEAYQLLFGVFAGTGLLAALILHKTRRHAANVSTRQVQP